MSIPKFATIKDRIDWLVANKTEQIQIKKMQLKFADAVVTPETEDLTTKGIYTSYQDDLEKGEIKRDLVANTYNWLDSHGDVHVGNTFKKSISERAKKVLHLHDHIHNVIAKVGEFETIKEVTVAWTDLGVAKEGTTKILLATSKIQSRRNKNIFDQYLNKEIDQHSVGMRYVDIQLAVNDEDYEDEYKVWKQYIDQIGNREDAEKQGYFWAVKEAKLEEISAVLWGSNTITPTVENIEPVQTTQKTEPTEVTQKKVNYYSHLI
jgi:spore coat protein CotF